MSVLPSSSSLLRIFLSKRTVQKVSNRSGIESNRIGKRKAQNIIDSSDLYLRLLASFSLSLFLSSHQEQMKTNKKKQMSCYFRVYFYTRLICIATSFRVGYECNKREGFFFLFPNSFARVMCNNRRNI